MNNDRDKVVELAGYRHARMQKMISEPARAAAERRAPPAPQSGDDPIALGAQYATLEGVEDMLALIVRVYGHNRAGATSIDCTCASPAGCSNF